MVHNVGRNDCDQNVHVSIIGGLHGGAQVKVLDVTHHAVSAGCGHNTVEEQFGSDEGRGLGADISRIFDAVTTNSLLDMMWDSLFWVMGTHDAQVSGLVPRGRDETGMKNIVLVPGMEAMCCAKQFILVALACCHSMLSELLLSSSYLASSPVLGLKALPWQAM